MSDTGVKDIPPIGTRLSELAQRAPGLPAITCDGVTLTRGELDASSNRLARAYQERGVGAGDYVTIALPNSVEWLQAAAAVWKLGGIVQPLSARLPEVEFSSLLELAPRALLVGRADPRGVVPSVPAGFSPPETISDAPVPEAVSPSWKAMPSGGSTGRSKLIEVNQDSRIDPAGASALFTLRENGTQLVTGPLSHNTGLSMTVVGLLLGQHIVLMSRFDPEQCLRLIGDHRVEFTATVPTVMRRLLPVYQADPGAYDLSSLEYLWHTAEPCPPAVKQAWIEILGPDAVHELYSGTELQAITAISGSDWLDHRGSVGTVIMGEIKVLDEQGRECPPGTVGEIFMRSGPQADPTYRYIGSDATVRDGWETLGDLGWFDEDGFLYLSDRRVDMFNVGGRKVYPAEVEVALIEHPEVLSCLVVGIPDHDLGQVPGAIVERVDGSTMDADAVRAHLKERVEGYKVPRHIEFTTAALRDEAGKARRSQVRQELLRRLAITTDESV
ncbi:AMP-binding protein [Nocardioides sp. LHD-245]|uniref:AMP-binding protein n=1 Tax=Nocardioides sp. LHD-245 TaxID=3051387 RepID=UPI0027DFAC18|nr:AMP-binding protein [Nocardioides sp. LHD-245]